MANPINTSSASFAGTAGDFGTLAANLSSTLKVVSGASTLGEGCDAIAAGSLAGKIAVVSRGTCSFAQKIRNAQAAGAVAVVVVDNRPGDPVLMGGDGTPNQPTLPAFSIAFDQKAAMVAANGAAATIGKTPQYFVTTHPDVMADFSSQGPTDVDYRVKPDVVAPGVSVISSIPANACATPPCFAFFQGTSMATPHLAGTAAFLRGAHPDWTAAQIRSAVVNTAARGVLKRTPVPGDTAFVDERNVNVIGAGRLDVLAANNARALLSPVSVSFGAVPSGSGQSMSAPMTITNAGTSAATWALSVSSNAPDASVIYSVSPSTITLAPGATATVTVTMSAAKGASFGGHQATLEVGSAAHAALYAIIK
jgi:subtilisin family serine protease